MKTLIYTVLAALALGAFSVNAQERCVGTTRNSQDWQDPTNQECWLSENGYGTEWEVIASYKNPWRVEALEEASRTGGQAAVAAGPSHGVWYFRRVQLECPLEAPSRRHQEVRYVGMKVLGTYDHNFDSDSAAPFAVMEREDYAVTLRPGDRVEVYYHPDDAQPIRIRLRTGSIAESSVEDIVAGSRVNVGRDHELVLTVRCQEYLPG